MGDGEIKKYLAELKTPWEVLGGKKIRREFKFSAKGGDSPFMQAMDFVNKVAVIAESEGHHPDIYIFYNTVTIELWTHAISGLFENDFILAAKIEEIFGKMTS